MAGARREWGTLEALRQPGEESAARAELRGADADPGAVADLVDLVEQVDDVEAQLEPLVESRSRPAGRC